MTKADLHIHTTYSIDGELEPEEIIDSCMKAGVNIISFCDHNSVKAIPGALKYDSEEQVKIIPGIEIDCNYKGIDLHLLGYNINWKSGDFNELENQYNKKSIDSFSVMLDNLKRLGIEVNADDVLLMSEGRPPCAELIAEVLLTNEKYNDNDKLHPYRPGGERSDMPYINFYYDYFAQGRPAYVKIDHPDYDEAVALVRDNGGIPVISHPGLNLKGREEIIGELLDKGAEGLELFNNYHDEKQITYFADIAGKRNALATCGSDFHGKNKPLIKPGIYNTEGKYWNYVSGSILKLVDRNK